ncbi:hypothetical protein [Streptococcus suis]|uniref:Polysaccharide biosynthesis protein cpsH(V) n=1 Tax=Streptococcus suis TaxID=1307 RepID=A0A0Z8LEX7_STRSU|nr:hypothetical protein [Streptococcus suis]NQG73646.1 hypothetical protein [Streptococcus suis]CYV89371.1 polysaccharide biosynthesis protein cpsH(V) [Streptococcus suis]
MIKSTKGELLYITALFMIAFAKGFGLDSSSLIYDAIFYVSMVFIFLKVIHERWMVDEFYRICTIIILLLLNFLFGKDISYLFSFIYLVGTKNIDINKILKTLLWARGLSFISLLIVNFLGLINSRAILFYRNGYFIMRSDLGFGHPNLAQSSFSMIVLLFCYLFRNRINFLTCILIAVFNHILYQQTFSRTSYYLTILILIFFYLERILPELIKKITDYAKYVQFALLVLTVILAKCIQLPIIQKLDILFTGRIYYSAISLNYGTSLFGKPLSAIPILFDNSYSLILYNSGLLMTVLLMYSYYKTASNHTLRNNKRTLIFFIMLSILLFSESYYANVLFNVTLFFSFKELVWNGVNEEGKSK